VLRAGRAIIELERRARAAAKARGKSDELAGVDESVAAQEVSPENEEREDPESGTEKPSAVDAPP
jgi:hypothetical protein